MTLIVLAEERTAVFRRSSKFPSGFAVWDVSA